MATRAQTIPNAASDAPLSPRQRTKVELLLTAERLFAEQGPENVTLRQIATAAGYANPATIQYHFGTKDALFSEIIRYRLPAIDARRVELLADQEETTIEQLVEAIARPYLELPPSNHYPAFVGRMVSRLDSVEDVYDASTPHPGGERIRADLDRLLADEEPDVRAARLNFATILMAHAIADRRNRQSTGRPMLLGEKRFEQELLQSMASILDPGGARTR